MKASVIIPVKNGMPFIRETLAALRGQTYASFEVLVVDDASTDNTREFVQSLGDDRIILLKNDGAGCASAFNTGLGQATGEIVMRCDADDIYPPHRLADQINWLKDHPEAGAVSGYMGFMWVDGKPVMEARSYEKGAVNITSEIKGRHVRSHNCAMAYRIEHVKRIGGMRPWFKLCEDVDFLVRLSEICDIWYVDQKAYTARLRPNSLSRSSRAEMSDWYFGQVEVFRQQREKDGKDQLDLGDPPPLPTWSAMRASQSTRVAAASLLIGAAWQEMAAGRTREWLKYSARAIRYDPTNWQCWWTTTALGMRLLRQLRGKNAAAV